MTSLKYKKLIYFKKYFLILNMSDTNKTSPKRPTVFANKSKTISSSNKKKSNLLSLDLNDIDLSKLDLSELDMSSDNALNLDELKQLAEKLDIKPPKGKTWGKTAYANAIEEELKKKENENENKSENETESLSSSSSSETEEEKIKTKSNKTKIVLNKSKIIKNRLITGEKFMEEEAEIEEGEILDAALKNDDNGIITLLPDQMRHVIRLMEIMNEFYFALDPSAMGAGKTYSSMWIYLNMMYEGKKAFKHLVYISTPIMISKVGPVLTKYGLPINNLITYQTLRSVMNKQPKHGLLIRIDNHILRDGKPATKTSFECSDKFKKMVREGCLLIVDEIQHIKNDSLQNKSVAALEDIIIAARGRSKVLELSGIFINKEEQCNVILYRYKIVTASKFFNLASEITRNAGIYQLIDWCMARDAGATREILSSVRLTKKTCVSIAFTLFESIVEKIVGDEMEPPKPFGNISLDIKNGFYNLSKEDQPYFDANLITLIAASRVESNNPSDRPNWGLVKKSLRAQEICEINIYARLGLAILQAGKNNKLVIGLNYTLPIEILAEFFANYGVIVINGDILPKLRNKLIQDFNAPNNDYRVFIGNIAVVNASIDLDDKNGKFPRFVLGSPSHFFINSHQFSGRFIRSSDTKSSPVLRWVYVNINNNDIQTGILNNLSKGGRVCERTLKKQSERGIKFPGQYDAYIEPLKHVTPGPFIIRDLLQKLPASDEVDDNNIIQKCLKTGKIKPNNPISEESDDDLEEEIKILYHNKKTIKTPIKKSASNNNTTTKVEDSSSESEEERESPMIVPSPSKILPIKNTIPKKKFTSTPIKTTKDNK